MGYLLLCASLLKEHRFEDFDQLSGVIIDNPPAIDDVEDVMKFKGIQMTLHQMRHWVANNELSLIDNPDFDPVRVLFPEKSAGVSNKS